MQRIPGGIKICAKSDQAGQALAGAVEASQTRALANKLPVADGKPGQLMRRCVPLVGMALVCPLMAGGCAKQTATYADVAKVWRPWLLYVRDEPYDRLVVEVDVVEGSEPHDVTVETIRETFEAVTEKPGGIVVRRDETIALEGAKGVHPHLLALRHMNGPGEEGAAYCYILFYNSEELGLHKWFSKGPIPNPHVIIKEYPAFILFNRASLLVRDSRLEWISMKHEVGHLVGLSANPEHTKGAHCTNEDCVMQRKAEVGLFAYLLQFQEVTNRVEFCEDCLADLGAMRASDASANARFHGGALVREGDGYTVAVLPRYRWIWRTPNEPLPDWRVIQRQAEEHFVKSPSGYKFAIRPFDPETDQWSDMLPVIRQACNDPEELLRNVMAKLLETLNARHVEGVDKNAGDH